MFDKLSERYTKIFERPAPVAVCDKASIEESSPPCVLDGYFIVKNTGGGNLEGDVFAGSSLITLSTQLLEGNDIIIEYEIDLRGICPGNTFESRIVLTTSGGQLIIPVKILVTRHGIKCGRFKIRSLQDFSGCARAIPEEAAMLFKTPEFEQWLIDSNCEHMEFYYKLAAGLVGEKQIDSFLMACGVKEKAAARAKAENVVVSVPFGDLPVTEVVPVVRVSWGEFGYSVGTRGGQPWLTFEKNRLLSSDFEKNEYPFKIYIDPKMMKSKKCFETLIFDDGYGSFAASITAVRQKPLTIKLSRLSYKSEDVGYLIVENNTGRNAMLEVAAFESFVRFKAAKYLITERAEIPFEIKVNSFLNLGFGKKPINVSDVICRTVIDGKVYKEKLTVKAGSLLTGL